MSFFDDDGRDTVPGPAEPGAPRRGRPSRGRPRPRRRPPGGPRRPGGGGAAALQQPAARLVIALGAIVVLVLVIALVVRDCRRDRLVSSYRSYLVEGATPIATQSAEEGKQLLTTLANQKRQKPEAIQQQVRAIGAQARQLVARAEQLDPPDALGEPHRSLITSLKYRVNGLEALAAEIPNAVKSRDDNDASARIAQAMARLLASDVIYSDSFVGPARAKLEDDDIEGVKVPESTFLVGVAANAAGPAGARRVLVTLRGGGSTTRTADAGSTARRGTGIVSTKVLPSGKELVPGGTVNTIAGSGELQWEVTIENGGELRENGIKVKATLASPSAAPQPVEGEIETVDSGERASIRLPVGQPPAFGENATLTVEVEPVPGEALTGNNTAKYTVRFSL